jgi:uncharacterized membrane protein YfhO
VPHDVPLDLKAEAPLDYLRNWGVLWYVIDSRIPLVTDDEFKLVYSDKFRNVLRDSKAKPMAYWLDGNGNLPYTFNTNSVILRSNRKSDGILKLNVLFNPYFSAETGRQILPLTKTEDGQMAVAVPGGDHEVVIKYRDLDFEAGVKVMLASLLSLAAVGLFIKYRKFNLHD